MNHRGTEGTEGREREEINRLTEGVIGAAIEVHRVLGPGFLEAVYEEALCVELQFRRIPFKRQEGVFVNYKGRIVGEGRIDILVANKLIVELKAVEKLSPVHEAQVLSDLKMTSCPVGLLINFKVPLLKDGLKRIILS